ncbi:MAG: PKD domain-containing protein [Kineosporiaceae bacterium]
MSVATTIVLLVLASGPLISDSDNSAQLSGESVRFEVQARVPGTEQRPAAASADGPPEVRFIDGCTLVGGLEAALDCLNTPCPDGTVRGTVVDVSPGADSRAPVDRFSDGCFGGDDPAVLEVVVAAEFRDSVSPSGVVVQPGTGRALVNLPLVTHAEPVSDTWTPTLLGAAVTIRATPVSYSWDFGDGAAPVIADRPGGPYPDHAAEHTYVTTGDRAVTLTTTYTGQYSLDSGATWAPIPGTATATSGPVPVRLVEARAHLTG